GSTSIPRSDLSRVDVDVVNGRHLVSIPVEGLGGELDEGQEKGVDLTDGFDEVLEVDGLADERVGVQRVAAHDVLFGLRGGQHDDRDHQQLVVLFRLREDLHAAAPGQVDVEQDEPGARRVGVRA